MLVNIIACLNLDHLRILIASSLFLVVREMSLYGVHDCEGEIVIGLINQLHAVCGSLLSLIMKKMLAAIQGLVVG